MTSINTIIFKGPSNAGKTKICKFGFPTHADLSQGINKNFWLESALSKRVIAHDEAQFSEEVQEDVKKLMEGIDMQVHRKGLCDAYLKRTPYMITCNTWPWCRFMQDEHIKAFRNRAFIVRCEQEDYLARFMEGGDLDPRVWLDILNDVPTPPDYQYEGPDTEDGFDFDSCDEQELCIALDQEQEPTPPNTPVREPSPPLLSRLSPGLRMPGKRALIPSYSTCPYSVQMCPMVVVPDGGGETSNELCYNCLRGYDEATCLPPLDMVDGSELALDEVTPPHTSDNVRSGDFGDDSPSTMSSRHN